MSASRVSSGMCVVPLESHHGVWELGVGAEVGVFREGLGSTLGPASTLGAGASPVPSSPPAT